MEQFNHKVAVITGAASGIGEGLARHCTGEGMRVVLADVNEARLGELARELGGDTATLAVDVSRPEQVAALADLAWERFGQVDVLFNNAGVLISGSVWECPLEDWQWILNINLMGVLHGVRSFVPRMLEQGTPAHIVNTSSLAGLLAAPLMGPYTVAKQAVLAMTETLYYELEASPIGVSVLCPGPIATGIAGSGVDRQAQADPSPAQRQLMAFLSEGIDHGMTPAACAALVFEAIRENRFWVFTHEDFKPEYQRRTERMIKNHNPHYEQYVVETD